MIIYIKKKYYQIFIKKMGHFQIFQMKLNLMKLQKQMIDLLMEEILIKNQYQKI